MTAFPSVGWEYLTIPEQERHRLATLGEEGWELVGLGGSGDDLCVHPYP